MNRLLKIYSLKLVLSPIILLKIIYAFIIGRDDENLAANIIEDPNGEGFSCGLCGKGLGTQKGNCRRHIRNVHSKSSSNLTCEFCQKSYKNYDTLRSHQRANHGVYRQ